MYDNKSNTGVPYTSLKKRRRRSAGQQHIDVPKKIREFIEIKRKRDMMDKIDSYMGDETHSVAEEYANKRVNDEDQKGKKIFKSRRMPINGLR